MALTLGRVGRGQSLAEFALVLPIFLALTLFVIDGARVFMAQISLTNGVREATMFALAGHYGEWCRDPSESGEATVSCPAGAGSANYQPDPGNLAYRLAGETQGLDNSRITLLPPLCGLGPGAPTQSCPDVVAPVYVTIRATYRFDPITPGLSQLWGSTILLQSSATARVGI
jgi:hypothetical protein